MSPYDTCPYDTAHYDPPAPVAQVLLCNSQDAARRREASLLIDTGADITLLPRSAVDDLGIRSINGAVYELIAFDGARSRADAVELDMIFLKKVFRGRYILIDADHGILGRDVLASVALLLDGPRQEWSSHETGNRR